MLAMHIYEKKLVIKDNKSNTGVGSIVITLCHIRPYCLVTGSKINRKFKFIDITDVV